MLKSLIMAAFLLPQTAPIPFEAAALQHAAAPPFMPQAERKEWNPPKKYDHPFKGTLDYQEMPQKQLVSACEALLKPLGIKVHSNQRGCSYVQGNKCHVISIDTVFNGTTPQAVLRHETGHCNGWPADHSD